MRKARRNAEQTTDPPMSYPQYSYPQSGPSLKESMYDNNMGTPTTAFNPAGVAYFNPSQGGNEQMNFNIPSQMFQNPALANIALQYGQNFVGQGKVAIDREINKYLNTSRVKYYFSVDTTYVFKKLGLLLFPFTHADWSVKYNPEEPVQPRYELNAPDLYIPAMAFVTYILTGGVSLGLQNRFAPEVLGIQASTALVWAFIEVFAIWMTLYIMNIKTELKTFDILAYSTYKYVGMIVAILASFLIPYAYHPALIYVSASVMFFLIRSLKVQVLLESSSQSSNGVHGCGSKKRTYLLLFIAGLQPLLMWWLTRHLAQP